jgi:pilus assembly protein CpaB
MAGAMEQKGARSPEPGKGRLKALIYLSVAVVAALGTAVLLTRYMDTRIAAVRIPTEKVVVAVADLPIATTLRADVLTVVDWPIASRPDGTVADPAELEGKVVNVSIGKGEPILRSKLASGEGKSALSTVLPSGMRAVSVRVDDVVGVAGFIHPGDHVDVIVTMSPQTGSAPPISKIILQNIKVLAVGKELESRTRDLQKPVPATVATLMVDSEQSERLALSASKGQILLALRSGIDEEVVATSGVAPQALLGSTPSRQEPEKAEKVDRNRGPSRTRRPAVAKAAPAATPPRDSKTVEILRGDLFEKRDFHKEGNP